METKELSARALSARALSARALSARALYMGNERGGAPAAKPTFEQVVEAAFAA